MYIMFCTQKQRFFVLARDSVGGQASMVHVEFSAYPASEQLSLIVELAERIKPHLEDAVVELYKRVRAISLPDLRVTLSDQLYLLTRKLKTQRNELDSGFLEGHVERRLLSKMEAQQASLLELLGLKKSALQERCLLRKIILEDQGWSACFGFDESGASEYRIGFTFDEHGRIWMPEAEDASALAC
jgi:hypothetical protein